MSSFLRLAVRNVARNRRRSLITLSAVLLGVTAVLVARGITDGFLRLMVEDVVLGRTGALQIHPAGYLASVEALPLEPSLPYDEALLSRIQAVPGVAGVSGRLVFSGLVSNGVSQTTFLGRGLDPARERQAVPRFGFEVRAGGRVLAPGDHAHALLGSELARSFQVVPSGLSEEGKGSRVTLAASSPRGRANSLDVSVEGLTESSLPFENKRVVAVPLKLAQELLGMEGRVTELAVAVEELGELEQVAEGLRAALGPAYEVHTWQELQPFVRDIIRRQKFILAVISSILFVIILTGIINTMLMSVFERVREIGTLLAVGVRRRQVLGLFLLEAAVLGLGGGVGGVGLGGAVVGALGRWGIPIDNLGTGGPIILRPEVDPFFAGMAFAIAVLGAVVAAAWPAWKASRLNPVDALRSN
jgi:putative ABC transport system permease protein